MIATGYTGPELLEKVQEDIAAWEEARQAGKMYKGDYLTFDKSSGGRYRLFLNGLELWAGTLETVEAVAAVLLALEVNAAEYGIGRL